MVHPLKKLHGNHEKSPGQKSAINSPVGDGRRFSRSVSRRNFEKVEGLTRWCPIVSWVGVELI